MINAKWSFRVLIRYTLLQLPVIVLLIILLILSNKNPTIPSKPVMIILLIWLAKDILLYPIVWRAYDTEHQKRKNPLIGVTGIVQEKLAPKGYVKIRGELWLAELIEHDIIIEEGEEITVCQVKGLTLFVRPTV